MRRRINPVFIGLLIVLAILAVFIVATFNGIDHFWENSSQTRVKASEAALEKAAIQCYALEGSYPPNLEYLQSHYGILMDKSRYYYHYNIFASNIMPEIRVFEKNAKKGVAVDVQ